MKAVVSEVELREPLDGAALDASELARRASAIDGFVSMQVIQLDRSLVLVITGEDEAALERIRDQVGNDWMREHVIPRAAGKPNRRVGDVLLTV